MKVELLQPDASAVSPAPSSDAAAFANALSQVSDQLAAATSAEDAYASGQGTLQAAMYERARADVALSVAAATAQRAAQALTSLLNMQI